MRIMAFCGGANVVGGEALEGVVDLFDEGQEWGFEFGLVGGFAGIEPVAIVMFAEVFEELEGFRGEVRGHGGMVRRAFLAVSASGSAQARDEGFDCVASLAGSIL